MSSTMAPKPRKKGGGSKKTTTAKQKRTYRATPPKKNADAGKATPAEKAKIPKLKKIRVKKGGDMLPEITEGVAAVGQEVFYWFGLMPSVTVPAMEVGGLSFQHTSFRIKYDKHTDAQTRSPLIGQVAPISPEKLASVKDEMRRLMFRFDEVSAFDLFDYTGEDLEIMEEVPPRRAAPIRIPTEAYLEERRKNKFAAHPYHPQIEDEPAIGHLFMVPCENQKRPKPGPDYPPPLSITGLFWPGEEPEGLEPEED